MDFNDILDDLVAVIKKEEIYKRSILLNLYTLDLDLNLYNTSFELLGLYNLKGRLVLSTDELISESIDCDFGFLPYLTVNTSEIKINVIDNKLDLTEKFIIPNGVKFCNNLNLCKYNDKLICIKLDFLFFFYKHNAHHVCLLDVDPFEFSLAKFNDNNSLDYLRYYIDDVVCLIDKCICFNFLAYKENILNLSFRKIFSMEDIIYNISICLNYFLPFILSLNLTTKVKFDIGFSKYACDKEINNFTLNSKLSLLQSIYDILKPLFNSNEFILIKIHSINNYHSSISGTIYHTGEICLNK